ncbi:flagellar motor switch protein FliG [Vibrio harveyi]|nr:flagellar motor switch protein FliG [Vibrio harveyi]
MKNIDLTPDIEHTAILLLSMGEEAAANVIKQLDREQVRTLSLAMANMPALKNEQILQVYRRFFEDFKRESGISGASRSYLERTLDKAFGPSLSQPLINSIYGDSLKQNLQALEWLEPSKIADLLRGEHPQMQAVFLAYLAPETATGVLKCLPEESMDDLLYRVASLSEIHPSMMEEVQLLISRFLEMSTQRNSTPIDGTQQASDIINRLTPEQSQQVLAVLKEQNPLLVEKLESQMYHFDILVRQSEETLEKLMAQVDQDTLALALKGADSALLEKIFAMLPKRSAQYLQETIDGKGRVRVSAVAQARKELVQVLRDLAERGEVDILLFSEPELE